MATDGLSVTGGRVAGGRVATVEPGRLAWARLALGVRARGVYVPSLLLVAATAGFAWEGVAVLERDGQLGQALLSEQNELTGPIVIGFVLLAVACERLFPAVRRPLLARGHLHDACFFLFFVAAVVPFVTVLGAGIDHMIVLHAPWLQIGSTASWPGWLAVGLALVLMDGCNWLTHLADHRVGWLWRVHAVHHSQEELSVLTTFRAHPLVHTTSTFAATLPVVALTGYHPITPALITGYLVLGALPHANVGWSYGPLGKVFCSPAYHRIHHRLEGRQDVNLGIVLSLFDVLARRAVFPVRGQMCATGLAGRPLEVEQARAKYRPVRLLSAQLVEPLTRKRRY